MNLEDDSAIVERGTMMLASDDDELPRGLGDHVADAVHALFHPTAPANIGENLTASWRQGRDIDSLAGDRVVLRRLYQPVVDAANRDLPEYGDDGLKSRRLENPFDINESRSDYSPNAPGNTGSWGRLQFTRAEGEDAVWGWVERLRKSDPGRFGNLPQNRETLYRQALETQKQELEEAEKLAASSNVYGQAAAFIGRAAGGMTDPVNILALGVGGGGSWLIRTFLREGAINAGITAIGMPIRAERMARLGHPQSAEDMAAEEAGSFLIGGAIPTGLQAGGRLLRRLLKGKEVAAAADPAFRELPPTVRAAALAAEDENMRAADNPFSPDDPGENRHRELILAASNAGDGEPPADWRDHDPGERGADIALDAERRRSGFTIQSFDPDEIGADAAAMQYKGGGDAAGVTDRLAGVTEWDPAKAGLSLIWQRADGSYVVADGHQRLALAKRAKAAGQDVPYFGALYREADGFAARDMRAIAAFKNIAEGSGTGIDAAQIFRDFPEGISRLPPRSPLVRQARDLSALSDDAYGMVRNGLASERDGAIVGRHVADPAMQTAMLGHLAKASPETAEEAELFVRQALAAGAAKEVQTDMFGSFLTADLILPERVKILKNALTTLRRDKTLFASLTRNEGAIASAGNVLDTDANAAHAAASARAFVVLKALAERKGPISDALQAAAERSKADGDRSAATREFVATVRAAARGGDFDRVEVGGTVGALEPAPEGAAIFAEPSPVATARLEAFADPAANPEALRAQSADIARALTPEVEMRPPAPEEAAPSGIKLIDGYMARAVESPTPEAAAALNALEDVAKRIVPSAEVKAFGEIIGTKDVPGYPPGSREWGISYREGARSVIAVSLEADNPQWALRHEAVHYLKERGLITTDEWGALFRQARQGGWIEKYRINERYPDTTPYTKFEEAIADAYGAWGAGELKLEPSSAIGRAFARIKRFIAGVGNALRGRFGKTVTANDVFKRIEGGEVGRRETRDWDYRPPVSEEEFGRLAVHSARPEPPASPEVATRDVHADFIKGQSGRSLDELYATAPARQAELDDAMRRAAGETGVDWMGGKFKDRATVEAKMARKGYTDAGQMTDIVRGKFLIDRPEQAERIVAAMNRHFDLLDEGWNVKIESGYIDRKLLVRFGDKSVGEIEIRERNLDRAVEQGGGHALYEQGRKLPKGSPELLALAKKEQALYAAALPGSEDWRDLVSQSGKGGSEPKTLPKTSGDMMPAVWPTSKESTSTQSSPGESTAQARWVSSQNTAGRKSQLVNISDMEASEANVGTQAGLGKGAKATGQAESAKEFGAAAPEIEALRALPPGETVPDPFGEGEIPVDKAVRQAEREARTAETLRKCMLGEKE